MLLINACPCFSSSSMVSGLVHAGRTIRWMDLMERSRSRFFKTKNGQVFFDGVVIPTDACLGVAGRPQSASGQTTILTGINAPARLGYHKQGFPNAALLEIIREHSIFRQLDAAGIKPITFANAYTQRFFDDRPRWISATTAAVEAAQLPFRTVADLKNGRAVFQDFTNELLIARGEDVAARTPDEAAGVLANVVRENRFTLYEYFITDKMGHAQDMDAARSVILKLAAMIRACWENLIWIKQPLYSPAITGTSKTYQRATTR